MKKKLSILIICLLFFSVEAVAQLRLPSHFIKFTREMLIKEMQTAPSATPHYGTFYVKSSDGLPYFKTSAGVEHSLALAVSIGNYLDLPEISEPGTPDSAELRLWVQDFHGFSLYSYKDDGGMVRRVGDNVYVGVNNTGSTIPANTAVYAAGNDIDPLPAAVELAPAKADSASTMPCIGVTVESIAAGAYGRYMTMGIIEDVNTSAFSVGDTIYVSKDTAGEFTATKPAFPNIPQEMGTIIVDHASLGAAIIVARGVGVNGHYYEAVTTATPSEAFTIDWTANHNHQVTITGANLDITFTNPPGPCRLTLKIIQGDGDDTIDWTNEADLKFPGGVDPVLSTGAGDVDFLSIWWDGTEYIGVMNYDFN